MRPRELLSTGVPRWTIHTETFRSDKSDRALKDLQELAVIAEQATPLAGNRLELCLRTRSNQVVLPSVEAALLRLKATVGELREKQQFIVTSKVMSSGQLEDLSIFLAKPAKGATCFQGSFTSCTQPGFLAIIREHAQLNCVCLRFLDSVG